MAGADSLARILEEHGPHVRAVAYRMLGSLAEADDAVQETWIRAGRADVSGVDNVRGWLTTVVARVCLDMLRARKARREDPLDTWVPDPVVAPLPAEGDPEADALRAEAVGLALLIVFEKLEPAERLAFVLHDVCGMSFEDIAPIVDRSVEAARQLASRARRRVRAEAPLPDADLRAQRRVVEAFLTAARSGDVARLVSVLDDAVVLRADGGRAKGLSRVVRGARNVVAQAAAFSKADLTNELVLINGQVGLLARLPDGRPFSVIDFTVVDRRIVAMHILADAERLARLVLPATSEADNLRR